MRLRKKEDQTKPEDLLAAAEILNASAERLEETIARGRITAGVLNRAVDRARESIQRGNK